MGGYKHQALMVCQGWFGAVCWASGTDAVGVRLIHGGGRDPFHSIMMTSRMVWMKRTAGSKEGGGDVGAGIRARCRAWWDG